MGMPVASRAVWSVRCDAEQRQCDLIVCSRLPSSRLIPVSRPAPQHGRPRSAFDRFANPKCRSAPRTMTRPNDRPARAAQRHVARWRLPSDGFVRRQTMRRPPHLPFDRFPIRDESGPAEFACIARRMAIPPSRLPALSGRFATSPNRAMALRGQGSSRREGRSDPLRRVLSTGSRGTAASICDPSRFFSSIRLSTGGLRPRERRSVSRSASLSPPRYRTEDRDEFAP